MTKKLSFDFSEEKNQMQKERWGFCFDHVIAHLTKSNLLDDVRHTNAVRYQSQRIFVVLIENYIYLVPYIKNNKQNVIFLKTFFRSRAAMKKYKIKKATTNE